MGAEVLIPLFLKAGLELVPKIVTLIQDIIQANGGEPISQEQINSLWARHKAAYDRAMAVDPNTKPE